MILRSKSIEELRNLSKELFSRNKECMKVYATVDGHLFFERSLCAAQMHARNAGGERPLVIHTITRAEAMGSESTAAETPDPQVKDPDVNIPDQVLLDKALEAGVITKAGAFFRFKDANIGQGVKKTLEKLSSDQALKTAIRAEIEKSTL